MDRLLGQNRIFVDRLQGVGVLTKEEAINRSCSGPNRAGQRSVAQPPSR